VSPLQGSNILIRIYPGFTPWAGVIPYRADHTLTGCFVAICFDAYPKAPLTEALAKRTFLQVPPLQGSNILIRIYPGFTPWAGVYPSGVNHTPTEVIAEVSNDYFNFMA